MNERERERERGEKECCEKTTAERMEKGDGIVASLVNQALLASANHLDFL